jgi:peptide deformylase
MTVPIISYGHVMLRQVCRNVDPEDPRLESIIANLTDTMDAANGVGLAGPQINEPIKIFMVDTRQVYERMEEADRPVYFPDNECIRDIFINARLIRKSADTFIDQEGCLSIPSIYEEIERSWSIEIEYFNSEFKKQIREFSGYTARAIQHEFDHTQGILFIDHLSTIKKKLLKTKLAEISEGKILIKYSMQFTW